VCIRIIQVFILALVVLFFNGLAVIAGWTAIPECSPASANYLEIFGSSSGEFYISSSLGEVYHFKDNCFKEMPTYTQQNIGAIWAANKDCVYIGGEHGTLLHWNGALWLPLDVTDNYGPVSDIFGYGEDDVYVLAGDLYHWDGVSWTSDEGIGFGHMWMSSPDDIFVIAGKWIFHFDGTDWEEQDHPSWLDLSDISGNGPDDVFAVSGSGIIIHYDGESWTLQNTGTLESFYTVSGAGDGKAYATSTHLWHFDGEFWTKCSEEEFPSIPIEMAYISDEEIHFAGYQGVCTWDGVSINSYDILATGNFYHSWGDYPDDYYVSGSETLHCINGQWEKLDEPLVKAHININDAETYTVSSEEFYLFDGSTWTLLVSLPQNSETLFTDIWGLYSDDLWITAYSYYEGFPIMYHWDGLELTPVFTSPADVTGFDCIDGNQSGLAYLTDYHNIYRFDPEQITLTPELEHLDGCRDIFVTEDSDVFGSLVDGIIVERIDGEWCEYDLNTDVSNWEFNLLNDGTLVVASGNRFHYRQNNEWYPSSRSISLYTVIGESINDIQGFGGKGHMVQYTGADLGLEFERPYLEAYAGREIYIKAILYNPGEPLYDVPVVIYMDIFGELFFWPDWRYYDPADPPEIEIQYYDLDVPAVSIMVVPPFEFPNTSVDMTGIRFYGAMLTDDLSAIRGEFGIMTFDF